MTDIWDEFMKDSVSVVTRSEAGRDDAGSMRYTDNPPVIVKGMMQQMSSKEAYALGLSITTTYEFSTVSPWGGGAISSITWDGRSFDQFGAADTADMGWDTDHSTVILVEKRPGVK